MILQHDYNKYTQLNILSFPFLILVVVDFFIQFLPKSNPNQ